jgi:MFS family permease
LVFGLLHGGVGWRWESWASVLVLGSAVVLLVLFVVVELRVPAPMLPMWVFRRRLFAVGNAATLAVGAITLGVTAYLPTYTQAVLGDGALSAVAAIGPFNLGWPIGTAVIGRVYLRFGFRATAALGGGITVVAAICLAALGSDSSWYSVAATTLLLGIGMGVTASPLLIAVQSAVDWTERGMVTATFQLSRSLGSAVGVAAFGAVANLSLAASFARSSSGTMASSDLDAAARMLGSATRDDPAAQVVRAALFDASHAVFVAVLVCAVLMFLVLLLVPDRGRHADAG